MSQRTPSPSGRDAATYLALVALLGMAVGLLGLSALVMPQLLGIVIVIAAFVFFGTFHYLVWGWWMAKLPPAEAEEVN